MMLAMFFAYATLNDPHFDRREAASERLTALIARHPALYGPQLGEWVRGATCPEVRRRALAVLAIYRRWYVVSYVPTTCPVWPIVDAMPVACPVLPAFALQDVRDRLTGCRWLAGVPSHPRDAGPHWHRYRTATERMIRERLAAGWTWEQADEVLARMWRLERRHCGDVSPDRWSVSAGWRAWGGGYP